MARFGIITPTIGRETLVRCVMSLEHQVFKDYIHFVVGDGPQDPWVAEFCAKKGVKYFETPEKGPRASFGANPRNLALEKIETEYPSDYVIFVDDDNQLLEPALYQANYAAEAAGDPPFLYQEILFTSKFVEEYYVMPIGDKILKQGDWDLLNGIYRADIISGLRVLPEYAGDFKFAQEAAARLPMAGWLKIRGICGIHHVSWDTYAEVSPDNP